uniref:Uncharacterized protein n=1 Tax=Trypanosoma vivax (strain Y486) TaxID=1055687 RepID=G0TSF8_TRYVY|nr:hypothetical protein, unlikely [Trypanosoma vivax Y486]
MVLPGTPSPLVERKSRQQRGSEVVDGNTPTRTLMCHSPNSTRTSQQTIVVVVTNRECEMPTPHTCPHYWLCESCVWCRNTLTLVLSPSLPLPLSLYLYLSVYV